MSDLWDSVKKEKYDSDDMTNGAMKYYVSVDDTVREHDEGLYHRMKDKIAPYFFISCYPDRSGSLRGVTGARNFPYEQVGADEYEYRNRDGRYERVSGFSKIEDFFDFLGKKYLDESMLGEVRVVDMRNNGVYPMWASGEVRSDFLDNYKHAAISPGYVISSEQAKSLLNQAHEAERKNHSDTTVNHRELAKRINHAITASHNGLDPVFEYENTTFKVNTKDVKPYETVLGSNRADKVAGVSSEMGSKEMELGS